MNFVLVSNRANTWKSPMTAVALTDDQLRQVMEIAEANRENPI